LGVWLVNWLVSLLGVKESWNCGLD